MEKNCLQCNKLFKKRYTESKDYWVVKKYCSLKCNPANFKKGHKLCTGRFVSKETREKMGKKKKGIKLSENHKKKLSESHMGDKNWHWNPIREGIDNTEYHRGMLYSRWTRGVKKLDNHKCRIDNKDCSGILTSHHILNWKEFPELRYDVNNGITLCKFHHPLKKEEVEKMSPYFQDLIKQRHE